MGVGHSGMQHPLSCSSNARCGVFVVIVIYRAAIDVVACSHPWTETDTSSPFPSLARAHRAIVQR